MSIEEIVEDVGFFSPVLQSWIIVESQSTVKLVVKFHHFKTQQIEKQVRMGLQKQRVRLSKMSTFLVWAGVPSQRCGFGTLSALRECC